MVHLSAHPARSEGGFRLYSEADEQRVERMRLHLREGLAAAEAARRALEGVAEDPAVGTGVEDLDDAGVRLARPLGAGSPDRQVVDAVAVEVADREGGAEGVSG